MLLEKTGKSLHQSILPLFAFTRGKVLVALQRFQEAEESFRFVVLADPENANADLELAVLCGKTFRFEESREWLDRLNEKEDEDVKKRAEEVRELLKKTVSGEREEEFVKRAEEMSKQTLGAADKEFGLPADLELLDDWIKNDPQNARINFDEIALLVGQSEVQKGARWKLSLAIESSIVEYPNGKAMNPFDIVAKRFESDDFSLKTLVG